MSNDKAAICRWRSTDDRDAVVIVLNVEFPLDLIVGAREQAAGFAELTVRGFPAAREGRPESSICTIYAQVGGQQLITSEFSSFAADRSARTCERAEDLAAAVIDGLAKGR